jgi:hypothetical protein
LEAEQAARQLVNLPLREIFDDAAWRGSQDNQKALADYENLAVFPTTWTSELRAAVSADAGDDG